MYFRNQTQLEDLILRPNINFKLYLCYQNGHADTVKFLVSQGADIEDCADYATPLVTAARVKTKAQKQELWETKMQMQET